MFDFLQTNLWLSTVIVGILSLMIGSFLNVVIYRYPAMMKQNGLRYCLLFLKEQKINVEHVVVEKISFIYPASHCPECKKTLRWVYKIPVISYLILKGRCAYCQTRINLLYPVIELLTAGLSVIVFLLWGWNVQTLFLLYFTWLLIIISVIDFKTQLIPDTCAFLLLWGGLFVNSFSLFASPVRAILGAIGGYLSLKVFQQVFYCVRKKEALGDGDLKLTAALLAWLGIQYLPLLLLMSAIMALIVALALIILRKTKWNATIPFGPFLSLSGWLLLVWGELLYYILR